MANVALGTAATQIIAPTSSVEQVTAITITNLGPNAIYVGPSNVTTATGQPVAAAATLRLEGGLDSGLWGIAATAAQASPADTRYFVETVGS